MAGLGLGTSHTRARLERVKLQIYEIPLHTKTSVRVESDNEGSNETDIKRQLSSL